ncbi:hypothetical protein P8C59_004695 [Phyllachora maydis]|uniref:Uncharacterized protein n=1 Tax=Phyllachora maydis TaxID=1825666 RepID=A0AAD9I4M5_9PEZI|nr:hypothetical protein P8C59_004695 [Phyllachora maydis]
MNSDHFPMTPPDSAEARSDQDNTAEIFLQIAREDTTRHVLEDTGMRMSEDPRAKPQITRHRRPLSLAIPPTQAFSPPRIPPHHV